MRVRIVMLDGSREIETNDGGIVDGPAVPCHRCGICCERWQPLLTPADAASLAPYLGLSVDAFHASYTAPYPFDDAQRLLRQEDGRCVFLRYDSDGRAACSVHAARPRVCRDWRAGLDRKECIRGLARLAGPDGLIPLEDLYPDPDDRAAAAAAFR